MTRRLVLWRHGRTGWNAAGRTQGQSDVDLDEVGRAQAEQAAPLLASMRPTAVVASDLRRAADTAAALIRLTGLEASYDPRLRELNFGEREGTTLAEARERWPDLMRRRDAGDEVIFPGAETTAEAANRFADVLKNLAATMGDDDLIVVVSHGGVMRAGACLFLGLPEEYWMRFGSFANCYWTVLVENRLGWRIQEWNAGSLPQPVLGDDER
jgi:glucosyl-3-phosphoglycerate phosphatase